MYEGIKFFHRPAKGGFIEVLVNALLKKGEGSQKDVASYMRAIFRQKLQESQDDSFLNL